MLVHQKDFFFETINAAGVLQVPMIISVWDDGYGISVPSKYQTTKESISEILSGFQRNEETKGYEILRVKGWDYPSLIETYQRAERITRKEHVPCLIHVEELTQPQGHSTSGSHERYKSKERLEWELEFDPIKKMEEWMIETGIATEDMISSISNNAKKTVRLAKSEAWKAFTSPIKEEQRILLSLLKDLSTKSPNKVFIQKLVDDLNQNNEPLRRDVLHAARKALRYVRGEENLAKNALNSWLNNELKLNNNRYTSHLYSESEFASSKIQEVLPEYDDTFKEVDARVVLRENFDTIFMNNPEVLVFGEDTGAIGDVNQGLEGLQDKYGKLQGCRYWNS